MSKDQIIKVRITAADKQRVLRAAERAGVDMSTLVRDMLLRFAARYDDDQA